MTSCSAARRTASSLVVCFLGLAWGACEPSEDCTANEVRCEGNTAATCFAVHDTEFTSHNEWRREDCGSRQCTFGSTNGRTEVICAVGGPDTRCSPSASRVTVCPSGGASVLTCQHGYVIGEVACGETARCFELSPPGCSPLAFCSETQKPDPLCAGNVFSACDGNLIVSCSCGMRIEAHVCQSPGPTCAILEASTSTSLQVAGCR
jgi:hypothetical protein